MPMSEDGNGTPKLYIHKPKKDQVKQARGTFSPKQVFTPPPPPPSSSLPSTPPIPAPVKESFVRRYKYLWPLLLTVNLAYGAYLYKRIKKQRAFEEEETAAATDSSIINSAPSTQVSAVGEKTSISSAITTPRNAGLTVPVEQQRALFKWILDEKRKIKPRNVEEKNHVDEDKAVLKQFIRAEFTPNL